MNTFQTVNPHNEFVLQEYRFHSENEISTHLVHSERAYTNWRKTDLARRLQCAEKLAELLEEEQEELAIQMTLEMGKPIDESRGEISKCALLCRFYLENASNFLCAETIRTDAKKSYLQYDPIGSVLGIMPWNFPFWQVFRCAVPAIIAGNAFILKHALNVMGCALAMEKLFLKAGFPDHLFLNTIADHASIPSIIRHRQIGGVALTGSTEAGIAIGKLAGEAIKPAVLELGGSDAFIVLEDCDIDGAVEAGVFSRMLNNGQSCIAAKRFLIQESIYDVFVEKIVERVSKIRLGDPMNSETTMGPMARLDLHRTLADQVARNLSEGAALRFRHTFTCEKGYYFSPVVLTDVKPGQTLFLEESFGPAIAISKIDSLDEAVKISNQSSFGLGATIWTNSDVSDVVISQLDVGTVAVNGFVKSDPRLPFGGTKKSGYGRELSKAGLLAFTNEKTVSLFK